MSCLDIDVVFATTSCAGVVRSITASHVLKTLPCFPLCKACVFTVTCAHLLPLTYKLIHHQERRSSKLQVSFVLQFCFNGCAGGSLSCCNTVSVSPEWSTSTTTAHHHASRAPAEAGSAPVGPSPRPTMDFLHELQEAASSLQTTPTYATTNKPFSPRYMDPQLPPTPASPHSAAEGNQQSPSDADFAQLSWSALHVALSVKAARLDTMTLWLQEASLQCAMQPPEGGKQPRAVQSPAPAVMQDAFRLQAASGIEHSALQDSQGQSLACHILWKPGILEQQVSVHVGSITVVHVPGLVTNACTFAGLPMPSSAEGTAQSETGTNSIAATETSDTSPAGSEPSIPLPGLIVSVSVLSVAFGALSSAEPPVHAVWLISSRLSMHLGPIRARGRSGSLSAGLLALQKPSALPTVGLRVSAVGLQLGIVPHWQGAVDPGTLWPLGAQVTSQPFEVQALVQGWPMLQGSARSQFPRDADRHNQQQQLTTTVWPSAPLWRSSDHSNRSSSQAHHELQSSRTEYKGPTTESASVPRLVSLAGSALELHLTGTQLAVMSSVAGAITAETSRRFQQGLPQQALPPASETEAEVGHWLGCLSVQTSVTFAMLTLDQDLNSVLATVPFGLQAAASDADQAGAHSAPGMTVVPPRRASPPAVVVLCDVLMLTMASGPVGPAMPAVSVTMAEPHIWGSWGTSPTCHACLPACDMHMALVSMPAHESPPLLHSPPQMREAHHLSTQHEQQPARADAPGHAAAVPQQHPSIRTVGRPLAVTGAIDIAVAASSASPNTMIQIQIQSVSLDVEPCHISPLVHFLQCIALGPAVPVLPCYPPATLPQSSGLRVEMEVQMLFGQVHVV